MTKKSTFEHATNWLKNIQDMAEKNCITYLIGNKIDLLENKKNKREVPRTEAENFAKRNRIIFFELSAKKSGDINRCIEIMIKKIYDTKKESYKASGSISESFIVRDSVIQGEENSNYVCC